MADERHDQAPDTTQCAAYCTTTPTPGTYLTLAALAAPCPDCGHAAVLHMGAAHCPVCELVDLNARARHTLTPQVTPTMRQALDTAARREAQKQSPHRPC